MNLKIAFLSSNVPVGSLNLCRYPEISLDNGAKSVDAARYPEISLDKGDELEPMPLSRDISG